MLFEKDPKLVTRNTATHCGVGNPPSLRPKNALNKKNSLYSNALEHLERVY